MTLVPAREAECTVLFAGETILVLGVFPLFLTQNHGASGGEALVFERPGNRWYEGALKQVSISVDGNSAIFFDDLGTELYSVLWERRELRSLVSGQEIPVCSPDGREIAFYRYAFCGATCWRQAAPTDKRFWELDAPTPVF